ncbi:hypothetical protein [Microcoleus sp. EPA2]|uniref:hypothetical protein n=1 Tax=Microcoleus sp. EPA2 TaxID=2841654 RepID=UPI00312B456A
MANGQLSLFDTGSVARTYKAGDLVKLKRKTPHAALLKRGDIVRVETVHPGDGSIKFWNERTESWGYLYPDEFSVVTESSPLTEIDSVTPVESAVTESSPLAEIDSVTPVESVVTESSPLAEIDSVTPVESAVTESSPLTEIDSVTPVESAVTESSPLTEIDSVTLVESAVTESIPPDDSVTSAISTYRPRGTARGGDYFRFSYRDNSGKTRHIHIRGGNTKSLIAQAKVQEVRSLLIAGVPNSEIAAMLRNDRAQLPLCD